MLRMNHVLPIRSCSKAPGVFSSTYRYPASSPEVHFHRASPRDSSPVITLFVHVGIYPTRNCAHVFLDMDHFFIPIAWERGVWPLRAAIWTNPFIAKRKGSFFLRKLPKTYNRPSPAGYNRSYIQHLRTIIVIADIHRGLHSPATFLRMVPTVVDLPALVKCHPLYILLRVRRELCFW
jgi:hypothetical protein